MHCVHTWCAAFGMYICNRNCCHKKMVQVFRNTARGNNTLFYRHLHTCTDLTPHAQLSGLHLFREGFILQQDDDDSKHTSKLCENISKTVVDLLPQSPDLKPIKHLWGHLKTWSVHVVLKVKGRCIKYRDQSKRFNSLINMF